MTAPATGRHRQLGPWQRLVLKIWSAIVVLAILIAAYAILKLTPDADTMERPFVTNGNTGEQVVTHEFTVKVTDVRFGQEVTFDDDALTTGGVWVVIHLEATARSREVSIDWMALQSADGKLYAASDRVDQIVVGRRLQPGLPVEADVLFEVPRSAVASGLVAKFHENGADQRYDAMAQILLVANGAAIRIDKALPFDPEVQ